MSSEELISRATEIAGQIGLAPVLGIMVDMMDRGYRQQAYAEMEEMLYGDKEDSKEP